MPVYELARDDLLVALAEVMGLYHVELRDADVRIDVLVAYAKTDANGDPTGPAVKLHGHPCCAKVRVIGLRDRVAGRGDAEIIIDGDNCDTWPPEQLRAILDHELEHLELQVSDEGLVKRDDAERPKLRLREHDRQFGWFDSVARRHGYASIEVQQATQMTERDELRQLYLPGLQV